MQLLCELLCSLHDLLFGTFHTSDEGDMRLKYRAVILFCAVLYFLLNALENLRFGVRHQPDGPRRLLSHGTADYKLRPASTTRRLATSTDLPRGESVSDVHIPFINESNLSKRSLQAIFGANAHVFGPRNSLSMLTFRPDAVLLN
jgi:hypothetical protein